MSRHCRCWLIGALLGAQLLAGCKDPSKPPAQNAETAEPATPLPAPGATVATPDPETNVEATDFPLLTWLDPDAVSVIYSKTDPTLDTDAFSIIFALPPKIERMLRDLQAVDEALDAVLDVDAPRPTDWLAPEALGTASVVSSGTYVVRRLTAPREDVESYLDGAGMTPNEFEGFQIYTPRGPFPWRVVFLADDVVGFIPVKEIGSGLSPLTAGRDLPPSALEDELRKVLTQDPDALLDIYAAGPLLHLDLGQDIAQLGVHARRFQQTGIDVEVRLAVVDDPAAAVASLSRRELSLETDRVREIARRVAFAVEGPVVTGRLQVTPADFAVMTK